MNVKISPSLLSADSTNLGQDILKISNADMLHIDVMDGHFVPNLSFGVHTVKDIRKITDKCLDVHLMINNPSVFVEPFLDAGSDILTVHLEAEENDDVLACLKKIQSYGKKSGLALNPNTDPRRLEKYLPYTDMILQMTVFPGFGGQSLVASSLENISEIRQKYWKDKDIEVDGGIYLSNCDVVYNCGANVFASGSGVFKTENPSETIEAMKKKCLG